MSILLNKEELDAAIDDLSKQCQAYWDTVLVRHRKFLSNRLEDASEKFNGWVYGGNQVGKGLTLLVELRELIEEAADRMGVDLNELYQRTHEAPVNNVTPQPSDEPTIETKPVAKKKAAKGKKKSASKSEAGTASESDHRSND